MTSRVKVSVIIPVYNAAEYLNECLNSVINQTLKEIEVICVDDGSTDTSLDILREFEKKDQRIKVLCQSNMYAGIARNTGMEVAQGEYFAFLDADDTYELDGLEKLYGIASANDLDVLKASSYLFDQSTGITNTNAHYSHERFIQKRRVISFWDAPKNVLNIADVAWNGLYRAEFIGRNNIQFNGLRCVNDRSFFIHCILKAKRIMVVDEFLTHYRINLTDSLVGVRSKNFHCQIDSYNLIKEIIINSKIDVQYKQLILRSELNQIFIWLDKFRKKGINTFGVEEALCAFLVHYDTADVGNAYLNEFIYSHEFNRICAKINLEYVNEKPEKPRVSVIIPVYNGVQYLTECLESVINQSLRDIEIICIDDGSSDDSLKLIQEYAKRDRRFVVLTQNHGYAGRARNYAISKARGQYVTFVDADDVIGRDFLELLYSECIDKNADVVVSSVIDWKGSGKGMVMRSWIQEKRLTQKRPFNYQDDPDYLLDFTSGGPGGKIFRLEFIRAKRIEFLPIRRSEDFNFVLGAIACAERISTINEAGYYYRRNNPASSESTKDETPVLFWEANMIFKANLQKLDYFDVIKRGYINNTINRFAVNMRAVKTVRGFEEIYNKLFEVYSTELELDQHELKYFYEGDFYKILISVLESQSIEDYLFTENRKLKERFKAKNYVDKGRYDKVERELRRIKNSRSYLIGRIITYLPRKTKSAIRCYHQHGLSHTIEKVKAEIQKKAKKYLK